MLQGIPLKILANALQQQKEEEEKRNFLSQVFAVFYPAWVVMTLSFPLTSLFY